MSERSQERREVPSVGICLAVDLNAWGEGASQTGPDDEIGVGCELEFHVDPEGAISIDLIGGHGDRRILVNSEVLRFAMAGAGVQWAKRAPA